MARLSGGEFAVGCQHCRDLAIGYAEQELQGIEQDHAKQRANVYHTLLDRLRFIEGAGGGDIVTGEPHLTP